MLNNMEILTRAIRTRDDKKCEEVLENMREEYLFMHGSLRAANMRISDLGREIRRVTERENRSVFVIAYERTGDALVHGVKAARVLLAAAFSAASAWLEVEAVPRNPAIGGE
ncbi:hypothetical protein GOB93_14135 [Acetobacter musti]|uniref:Uncharacterized protein n=1 Tax=Acetobacter musti TaxID=864732 RepID=A0ABX0JR28_9PROT|nr:hypothetical protein [Acetobacter musti]NHN85772.1 hypothetical protein [Acetobacter musti]